jgi:ferrous iron transport protein A
MNTTPLAHVQTGRLFRIRSLSSSPDNCKRLRELGFCENAVVSCTVNNSGSLICQICESRVMLSRALAMNILVAPVV